MSFVNTSTVAVAENVTGPIRGSGSAAATVAVVVVVVDGVVE